MWTLYLVCPSTDWTLLGLMKKRSKMNDHLVRYSCYTLILESRTSLLDTRNSEMQEKQQEDEKEQEEEEEEILCTSHLHCTRKRHWHHVNILVLDPRCSCSLAAAAAAGDEGMRWLLSTHLMGHQEAWTLYFTQKNATGGQIFIFHLIFVFICFARGHLKAIAALPSLHWCITGGQEEGEEEEEVMKSWVVEQVDNEHWTTEWPFLPGHIHTRRKRERREKSKLNKQLTRLLWHSLWHWGGEQLFLLNCSHSTGACAQWNCLCNSCLTCEWRMHWQRTPTTCSLFSVLSPPLLSLFLLLTLFAPCNYSK